MKSVSKLALILLTINAVIPTSGQDAQADPIFPNGKPTGSDILRLARECQSSQQQDLTGTITTGSSSKTEVPLRIISIDDSIHFNFYSSKKARDAERPIPERIVSLELKDNRYELFEQVAGQPREAVPAEKYGEEILGLPLSYEDLSMRFLYWPNPELRDDDKVDRVSCWVVGVKNPLKSGPYEYVKVWVGKESGALMRIEGWKNASEVGKIFRVNDIQRVKGEWILQKMGIQKFENKKISSSATMQIDRPKRF